MSTFFKYNRKDNKKWSVLIYANGNNELEPEVFKSFLELQNETINDNINVVVQLGRAKKSLVRSLRQSLPLDYAQEWHGVRRYEVKNKDFIKLEDLGNVNMADPQNFTDFVSWGIKNYPASNIMVIISGHGAGFVGVMTDYTYEYPYIMDINGLVNSLYKIKDTTGQSIDCMVLDACYMNMVEVWNEIALIPNRPVKYLLAPTKNVALEGLPYYLIIRYLQQYTTSFISKLHKCLVYIAENFNSVFGSYNILLTVKLNKYNFIHLKKEVNLIGELICKNNINLRDELNKLNYPKTKDPLINLLDLEELLTIRFSDLYYNKGKVKSILEKLIIYPKLIDIPQKLNQGPTIYLPIFQEQYAILRSYYDNLLFSQNNNWLCVLRDKDTMSEYLTKNEKKQYNYIPPPMAIPITYVVGVILEQNPDMTIEEAWSLIRKFGWHKNNNPTIN